MNDLKIIYSAGWFGLTISVLAPGGADLRNSNYTSFNFIETLTFAIPVYSVL